MKVMKFKNIFLTKFNIKELKIVACSVFMIFLTTVPKNLESTFSQSNPQINHLLQAFNQEFVRVGEFSQNQDILINISTATQEKKGPVWKKFGYLLLQKFKNCILSIEAVAPSCSVKKMFLEISQACNFIKKEILAQVFSCEFCESSKNTFSYRTPSLAASINRKFNPQIGNFP